MSIGVNYQHFSGLCAMLPRIINQDFSEQSVSIKYKHKPSEKKKRKAKDAVVDDTPNKDQTVNPRVKKQKVMSVEKMPSLDIIELKARLNNKIEQAKVTRKHSIERNLKLKEKRKFQAKINLDKKKVQLHNVKVAKPGVISTTEKIAAKPAESLQFSKFESKTKLEINLESSKIQKRKKKDLTKMLDIAKKAKKETLSLQKSTDDKSVSALQDKAWKKAISMAKGEKQKDNPELIVKAIKQKEQKKKKSNKDWDTRVGGQKKLQKDKQKKRQANVEKRIQGKKQKR